MELIYKGAEAELYKAYFMGMPVIIKRRIPKGYRIPELDRELRERRTRKEARLISKARKGGVPVPAVLDIWRDSLMLEYVEGTPIHMRPELNLFKELGKVVIKLHKAGISHNDLSLSNVLVTNKGLCLIDFGLAEASRSIEDFAVDLYVLKRSIKSLVRGWESAWKAFLDSYMTDELALKVVKRLAEVESRGRYK